MISWRDFNRPMDLILAVLMLLLIGSPFIVGWFYDHF